MRLRPSGSGDFGDDLRHLGLRKGPQCLGAGVTQLANGQHHTVFEAVSQLRAGALQIGGDAFFDGRRDRLVALAARHAVPAIYFDRKFVAAGRLVSYGGSLTENVSVDGPRDRSNSQGRKIGRCAGTKVELAINLETAKALGLTIPPSLLARADELVE
jgi:putative ABC transport system substrate-binding protein